jgi:hypothetical protein
VSGGTGQRGVGDKESAVPHAALCREGRATRSTVEGGEAEKTRDTQIEAWFKPIPTLALPSVSSRTDLKGRELNYVNLPLKGRELEYESLPI